MYDQLKSRLIMLLQKPRELRPQTERQLASHLAEHNSYLSAFLLCAADLLEELAGGSAEVRGHARQLRALLARKNVMEYESRRAAAGEARDAVARAGRLVDWAREVVRAAIP